METKDTETRSKERGESNGEKETKKHGRRESNGETWTERKQRREMLETKGQSERIERKERRKEEGERDREQGQRERIGRHDIGGVIREKGSGTLE